MQEATVHSIVRGAYYALIAVAHTAMTWGAYALAAWAFGAIVGLIAAVLYNVVMLPGVYYMHVSGTYAAAASGVADEYAPVATRKLNAVAGWLRSKAASTK